MTVAKDRLTTKPMTLEEYLDYDDGTDKRYELIDGILVDMGAESDVNVMIGTFLIVVFSQLMPHQLIRRGSELEVSGERASARIPDLIVLTHGGLAALPRDKRSLITLNMPAPLLVVEVVSSSDTDRQSRDRDYTQKREEYEKRGILEYWVVDPIAEIVLVLALNGDSYQEQTFTGDAKIVSPVLPKLDLQVRQLLNADA
ncbi:MAG: Uma2 family endonuclease [Cyanobacteria bacterium J06634_6]